MDIRVQPVKKPWFKGRVESFMNKVAYSRAVRSPGATLNISHRRQTEYVPKDYASSTLHEFRRSFLEWMLLEHAYEFHEEILDVPARRWDEAVKLRPIALTDVDELDVALGHHQTARLSAKGVLFEYLYYQCQQLQDLLFASGKQQLDIMVNPANLGSIMVTLPNGETVRAVCTDYKYASEVTLWQHRRVRAEARKSGNDWITAQNLHDALYAMVARTRASIKAGKAGRGKAARDLGVEYVSQPGHETTDPTLVPTTDLNMSVKYGNVSNVEPGPKKPTTQVDDDEDDVPTPKVHVNA